MSDVGVFGSVIAYIRRVGGSRKTAYALGILALVSGVATVATIKGHSDGAYDLSIVLSLLYIDGIVMLLLGVVLARKLVHVWLQRRRGQAGAGLHRRLVVLFSLVAVTPAILVAIFSALFLNFGMQSWFSDRINSALRQSMVVAKAYHRDHLGEIQTDALAIANELNLNAPALMRNRALFSQALSAQAALRSLSEAVVFDGGGQVLARTRFSLVDKIDNLPLDAMATAGLGKIAVLNSENDDRMRALVKLNRFLDAYLLVERFVDARVINHIDEINKAVSEYRKLETERGGIQVSFILIFLMVSLLLLLAAGWIGLTVSGQLVNPISRLIAAADEVSHGNLEVRVEVGQDSDEIGTLGEAFNNMTSRLDSQQKGLMDANRELDERRRFTETVLAGVSAGVIGLDSHGNLHLHNRSAAELIGKDLGELTGVNLGEAIPELAALLGKVTAQPTKTHAQEIQLVRAGETRTLLARIAAEMLETEVIGYVVTFDDVTELFSAQKKAAWADVARRIAHEIKNPLTPIQLSAERLRRKYQSEVQSDPETFTTCTETIIRQVEDIGRMVDEFSAFARMPEPLMQTENLSEICREVLFLERNRNPNIAFQLDIPNEEVHVVCDRRQVSQALTNVVKNAAESIESAVAEHQLEDGSGRIDVSLIAADPGGAAISIEDNGIGLPKIKDQLTDPYVTTREKGTGLGLAIVRKIMEDHDGALTLENGDLRGARVSLVFRASALDDAVHGDQNAHEDPEGDAVRVAVNLRGGQG